MKSKIAGTVMLLFSIVALGHSDYSGLYLGAGVGSFRGQDEGKEYDSGVSTDYTQKAEPSGTAFDITAGYNFILGKRFVLGAEGAYEMRSGDDTVDQKFEGVPDPDYAFKSEVESAASLRLRLGYLFFKEKTMAFVSGGYAGASIKRTFSDRTVPDSQSTSGWNGGWTAGGGLEHFITRRLSLQGEYRISDFGEETAKTDALYGPGFEEKQEYKEQSFRVGLMFHF